MVVDHAFGIALESLEVVEVDRRRELTQIAVPGRASNTVDNEQTQCRREASEAEPKKLKKPRPEILEIRR